MMTNNEIRQAMKKLSEIPESYKMTNNELEKLAEIPESYIMTSNEIREAMKASENMVNPVPVSDTKAAELASVDVVNHPKHYQSKSGLEVIDVIEAFTDNLKGIYAVDTGNAIKYICRWSHKNGVEDLKKARWYINNLIDHLEKEGEK